MVGPNINHSTTPTGQHSHSTNITITTQITQDWSQSAPAVHNMAKMFK